MRLGISICPAFPAALPSTDRRHRRHDRLLGLLSLLHESQTVERAGLRVQCRLQLLLVATLCGREGNGLGAACRREVERDATARGEGLRSDGGLEGQTQQLRRRLLLVRLRARASLHRIGHRLRLRAAALCRAQIVIVVLLVLCRSRSIFDRSAA